MQTNFNALQLGDPSIARVDEILRRCVPCELSTATCPTYVLTCDERDSPRGRVSLIKQMFEKGKAAGIETRGVSDHDFIHSIYFRDPNGYVIELAAPTETAADHAAEAAQGAHAALARWQETKPPGG